MAFEALNQLSWPFERFRGFGKRSLGKPAWCLSQAVAKRKQSDDLMALVVPQNLGTERSAKSSGEKHKKN